MRAVSYSDYGALPTLAEVPDPACPDDGAVVRVGATGVCRSDWHAWKGHDPVALPHIPGHELAGVVAETGPQVSRWRVGDRVTVPFVCGCGSCDSCAAGDAQVCPRQTQPGFTGPGSFAELVAIHAADTNLVALPDSVDFVTGASLGCRFATAFRALTVHGRIGPQDWLAVHGCGGVGLSAVLIGVALGARVIAVDVSAAALASARELGAEVVIDASQDPDPGRTIRRVTGAGAHASVDALGSPATAVTSVGSLRPRGRHIQDGLLLGPFATPPIPMDQVVAKELEIYGSHGMAAVDYPAMLELVADGTLRPDLLVGRVIGLEGAGQALAEMDRPSDLAGITMIQPWARAPGLGDTCRLRTEGLTVDTLDVAAIRVDVTSATPPFEQVRAHIAGLVARGELAPGTRLPTVRQLAADLGLAAKTAARVYRELEADGLIVTHGRRGTSVNSAITEAGSQSAVAARAREAAAEFTKRSRQLGLTRHEAVQLVEQTWNDS